MLWLDRSTSEVVAASKVEHTTSIYSGIVRMLDLALVAPGQAIASLYLGARYLPCGELEWHRESMARFGQGLKAVEAVSQPLAELDRPVH